MWDVVICDSDEFFVHFLRKRIEEFYEERDFEVKVRSYSNGHRFMDALEKEDEPMDLIFLNTKLSDMSGFVVAELIRLADERKRGVLIFLGEDGTDVFQSFLYQPFWYIKKNEWFKELDKALQQLWKIDLRERSLRVRNNRVSSYVRVAEIVFIESDGHYLRFHCVDGDYRFRSSMKYYEERLMCYYFVHPSKSYLINCAYVDRFEDKVIMKDGSMIPCSKSKKAEAQKMRERYVHEIKGCL